MTDTLTPETPSGEEPAAKEGLAAFDHRRRPAVRTADPVRPQRGRRTRPHRVRDSGAGDPRRVRAGLHRAAHAHRRRAGLRAGTPGPDRRARRPLSAGQARPHRGDHLGLLLVHDRPRDQYRDARFRPIGIRDRQSRQRPDPQLADCRLVRTQPTAEGLQLPSRGQCRRRDHRPDCSRIAGVSFRLAGTVLRVRLPDADPRPARASPARTDPRRARTAPCGRRRRSRSDRGDTAVVRRGLANVLENRKPPPDLRRNALSRRIAHRLRHPRGPALRRGLQPRRTRPRHRCCDLRARSVGRAAHRRANRDEAPRTRPGPNPQVPRRGLGDHCGAVADLRRGPQPRHRNQRQLPDRDVPRNRRPGHSCFAVPRHPAAGPIDGFLDGITVDPSGAADAAIHRVDRRQLGNPDRDGDDGPRLPHRWAS